MITTVTTINYHHHLFGRVGKTPVKIERMNYICNFTCDPLQSILLPLLLPFSLEFPPQQTQQTWQEGTGGESIHRSL